MAPHRSRRRTVAPGLFTVLVLLTSACSSSKGDPLLEAAASRRTTSTAAPTTGATGTTSTAAAATVPPTTTGPRTTTAGRPLRWVALGDSYSAGIGASTPEQKITAGCDRDPLSNYPALAAATLAGRGVAVELDVRSCDGATVRQIIDTQAAGVTGADIISVTLGGNDFGFSRVLADCLARGCKSYDQPQDTFPGFAHETGRSDWEVLEQRVRDALSALAPMLAPGGRVLLLTYPLPFPANPDPTCLSDAAPMNDVSRYLANAAIERLDQLLVSAAATANRASAKPFVSIVEWRTGLDQPLRSTTDASGVVRMIRDNPNGICSPDPMLNGIARPDISDSFHPTDRGLRFAADAVAAAIAAR